MTATTDRIDDESDSGSPIGRSEQQKALKHGPAEWLGNKVDLAIMVFLLAIASILRFVNIGSAYDVFVDEFFYQGLGKSAGQGHVPPHIPPGWGHSTADVFLLHPPGFFVLLGIWQHITGTSGDVFQQLFLARGLNALFGVLTVGLLFLFGRRLGGRWVGITAALIFALDPFVLRQNGRVLLETTTLFWVLAGYFVLVGLAQGRYQRPRAAAVAIGVLFGCAILTKDTVAIETVGAVLVLAALGWGIPRRLALWVAAVSVATYSIYAVACVAQGYGGQFWDQKTLGIRRQLGVVQVTGFNRPGSVSLTGTLWSELRTFAFTYVLVALGVVGAVHLIRSRRDDYRILGLFVASATAFMAYAGIFGTIEEQFLYFLFVPAVLSVATVSCELWRMTMSPGRRPTALPIALVAALAVSSLWNFGIWADARSTPDNATQSAVAWLKQHASKTEPIAISTNTQSYSISAAGLSVVGLGTPAQMAATHVRYLVLSTKITILNYSYVTPRDAAFFQQHARIVFTFKSASLGDLDIYETTDSDVW